jgi:hypothetical protein
VGLELAQYKAIPPAPTSILSGGSTLSLSEMRDIKSLLRGMEKDRKAATKYIEAEKEKARQLKALLAKVEGKDEDDEGAS